jgi:hypothetical protein
VELLGHGVRADRVSISTAGRLHHPIEFTRPAVFADQPVADVVDPGRVRYLVQAGATLVLASAELWIPPLRTCARDLAEELGCDVQAHVFVTGPGHDGLPPHADGEDNFLIQLAGEKEWSLWEALGSSARRFSRDRLGPPSMTALLRPGDVLYIPLGWVHAATAGAEGSTHVTYQIIPRHSLDVILDQLHDGLEPFLRDRPAPLTVADLLTADVVADIVQRVTGALGIATEHGTTEGR